MATDMSSTVTKRAERGLVLGLAAYGVAHLGLGLLMVLDPGTFFSEIGPFGTRNDHYLGDLATYNLAAAAVLFAAIPLRSWRVPVLALLLIQFALHSINHLIDIDEATPESVGVVDFVSLLVGTALLAVLLVVARRSARAAGTEATAR